MGEYDSQSYTYGGYGVGSGHVVAAGISDVSDASGFVGCGTSAIQPLTGTDTLFFYAPCATSGHSLGRELTKDFARFGWIGTCVICSQPMFIPDEILARNLDLEEAGTLLGRAMTLEDEDDSLGALIANIAALESRIKTEMKKHGRILKFAKMARDIMAKKAMNDVAGTA